MKISDVELKRVLEEHSLSMIDFAYEAGLHPQTLYKVGKKPLSRKSTRQLAEAIRRIESRRPLNSKAVG